MQVAMAVPLPIIKTATMMTTRTTVRAMFVVAIASWTTRPRRRRVRAPTMRMTKSDSSATMTTATKTEVKVTMAMAMLMSAGMLMAMTMMLTTSLLHRGQKQSWLRVALSCHRIRTTTTATGHVHTLRASRWYRRHASRHRQCRRRRISSRPRFSKTKKTTIRINTSNRKLMIKATSVSSSTCVIRLSLNSPARRHHHQSAAAAAVLIRRSRRKLCTVAARFCASICRHRHR